MRGGAARAAVFGVSDGLVSNAALILGMAGADPSQGVVRLAGIAGLLAGAVSMAAGEYISMRAQAELLERELQIEREQILTRPHVELVELAQIYQSRGVDPDTALLMARELMADPQRALEAHAREELGIAPDELGSPWLAAASSFASFSFGAAIPLAPWFFAGGSGAVLVSVAAALITATLVGALLAGFTGRSVLYSSLRQVFVSSIAGVVTYVAGRIVGGASAL
ncbi:MAG: membrane protein [Acidimicrobiales bacterium]|nr:MAG: membrane protein [Acidimicrobiales bacterium]